MIQIIFVDSNDCVLRSFSDVLEFFVYVGETFKRYGFKYGGNHEGSVALNINSDLFCIHVL